MKFFYTTLFTIIFSFGTAQQEYHVFPTTHEVTPGKTTGDGSLKFPWDLQTALNKKAVVKAGDKIWLHQGVYKGRFTSSISVANFKGIPIVISGYSKDKVIIDGNVSSNTQAVLDINGNGLVFKNFEITFQGNFPRKTSEAGFKPVTGVNHRQGANCKFVNLKIHNVPGSGIGSWKRTSNSEIKNCIIYNNGYLGGRRGHGVGIYVQNESNQQRIIEGNIIFANYYKGIQVWSASNGNGNQFVKNVLLKDNVIFNSGLPSGQLKDNLIVATGDGSGKHIAKNITVKDNVFYHNTDVKNGQIIGGGMSLTLGFHKNAPVTDIKVLNNVIVGGKDGLRLMHVKGLEFKGNTVYSEFVRLNPEFLRKSNQLSFLNNRYYTRRATLFRVAKTKDYNLVDWKKELKLDAQSSWAPSKEFKTEAVLKLLQIEGQSNEFLVNLFDPNAKEVTIDFSKFYGLKGQTFKVYDIENADKILKTGQLSDDLKVKINMAAAYSANPSAQKSLANFGVYRIVFEDFKTTSNSRKSGGSLLGKLFRKLGF
ncbi:right-handed parallel beta-helix repeat-containing protein [Winogradskyella sp. A3E31]|uniref:right-handed parallel beta-helix repeat-containing protein n=1 Tax=Winogradskyella sp. A3E31 TaxID=3349637 RepID=UPI00398B30EE